MALKATNAIEEITRAIQAGTQNPLEPLFRAASLPVLLPFEYPLSLLLPVEILQTLTDKLQMLDETLGPGTFWGDLLRASRGDAESLRSLAESRYFSRNALFVIERWGSLEPYFQARRSSDKSWKQDWYDLCTPNLYLAIAEVKPDVPTVKVYPILRRETRKAIERELLGGKTLDQHLGRKVVAFPEDGTPEMLELEAEVAQQAHDFTAQAEIRAEVERALDQLTKEELEALLAPFLGYEDEHLAVKDGVTQATVRKRRERARKKLR